MFKLQRAGTTASPPVIVGAEKSIAVCLRRAATHTLAFGDQSSSVNGVGLVLGGEIRRSCGTATDGNQRTLLRVPKN